MRLLLPTALLLATSAGAAGPPSPPPAAKHWSLRPLARPAVPAPEAPADRAWVRNPIDAFVLARLRREGLRPAPEAGRRALIRRVTFDLTGLPPAPEEVEAFERDGRPDAYERLV